MSQPIQLKDAIREKGYTVKDLHERVSKEIDISYAVMASYCRRINSHRGDKIIWNCIKKHLKDMKVEWREWK